MEWLLELGFKFSDADKDGNTALLFAAWAGHLHVMKFLLKRGSKFTEKNHNGHTVFLSAANGGRTHVVEWLLTQGFKLSETNNNGDTALLLASYGGHLPLVKRLLEIGANLSERNNNGFTALLSAANGGQKAMAEWLLHAGSSVTERDNDGYTCLILAACLGNLELVQFFISKGSKISEQNNVLDTSVLLAAFCGHKEVTKWLLHNGASIKDENRTKMGLLVSAANGGDLDTVEFIWETLTQMGIDTEMVDASGYTPFLLSVQRLHMPVVQYLASRGANIQATTKDHGDIADLDAITLLDGSNSREGLREGLREYVKFIWNLSPIQIAVDARMTDYVQTLLITGDDPQRFIGKDTPDLLTLATTTGQYRGALPPNQELIRLVTLSLRPWTPATTCLFGASFLTGIAATMIVMRLIRCDGMLPQLPIELWNYIASFQTRSWFPSDYLNCTPAGALAVYQSNTSKQARKTFQADLKKIIAREYSSAAAIDSLSDGVLLDNPELHTLDINFMDVDEMDWSAASGPPHGERARNDTRVMAVSKLSDPDISLMETEQTLGSDCFFTIHSDLPPHTTQWIEQPFTCSLHTCCRCSEQQMDGGFDSLCVPSHSHEYLGTSDDQLERKFISTSHLSTGHLQEGIPPTFRHF